MSNDNPFSSPYQSPSPSGTGGQAKAAGVVKTPGAFLAISIVAIVLGIMGISGGCCGGVGLAFQGAFTEMMSSAAQAGGENDKVAEMLQAIMAESQKFLVVNIILLSYSMVVSIVMLSGGIMGAMGKQLSKMLLIVGCGLAIPLRIVEPIKGFFESQAISAVQQEYMAEIGQGMDATGQMIGQTVGLVFSAGISVVMLVLYGVAIGYLLMSKQLPVFFAKKAAAQSSTMAR